MSHHLITIPAPGPWIRSNDHTHWRNRHGLTAQWRTAAAWEARRQHLPRPIDGPVAITATIHRIDRRVYDLDGITPTVKAAIDGLRDAGVLLHDDYRTIPELTLRAGEPRDTAQLVLSIDCRES